MSADTPGRKALLFATVLALAPLLAAVAVAEPIGTPDLTVDDITWSPASPQVGDAVTFTATVRNEGNAAAGGFVVEFSVGATSLGDVAVDGLAAGASTDVVSPAWTAEVGEHDVRAVADADLEVLEVDETDNARLEQLAIAPPPLPDLRVLDLVPSPAAPHDGQSMTFVAVIKNAGPGATGASQAGFAVDGVALGNVSIPALAAGEQADVTSPPWTAAQGGHLLRAIADVAEEIAEADEDNNQRAESLSVGAPLLPDLVVLDITLGPAAPDAGDEVTFVAKVKNAGDADAAGFDVGFALDGDSVGPISVDGLAAGATIEVTSLPWTAAQGGHSLRATADVGGDIEESHETNNARTESFAVGAAPLPDLRVEDITWSPSAPAGGQHVTFTAKLRNIGQGDAGEFRVAFFVDGSLLGEVAVDHLADGSTLNVASASWSAAQGSHTVKAVADSDHQVAEASESNNARTESLSVAAPPPPRVQDNPADDDEGDEGGVAVCHVPPGNPGNAHTIHVGEAAVRAHLAHGDHEGACDGDEGSVQADAGEGRGRGHAKGHDEAGAASDDATHEPRGHGDGLAKEHNPHADVALGPVEDLAAQSLAAFQAVGSAGPLLALVALSAVGAGAVLWVRRR
ncbi:MAG TPA: CARDB domain-containing protein [Candidatus Thermoplasmatota archaeon]|jgi:subtilase family serine protease|nr:CARDB domain-containing protein [Candidatus Thermoplasmatota archaeon]